MTTMVDSRPSAPQGRSWVDGKRYLWLFGLVVPLFPLMSGAAAALTGSEWGWWFTPLFLYAVIPAMDYLIGGDPHNPPEEVVAQLSKDRYYRYCVYAFLPLQFASLFWAMSVIAAGELSWVGLLGLVVSVGIVNGVAFNTAHELGHQNSRMEKILGMLALAPTFYGHFSVEHNRGHHVRVATPEDPASARYGESFWQFLPRTMLGSLRSAWALEKTRLTRVGKPVWHWQNQNLQAWSMSVVLYALIALLFGWAVLPFMALQSLYSMTLFEVINYLEHYGLCRQKLPSGRYERCQPQHSWNSNHLVTNILLYQLQRHSDHHANPTRSYQALRHFDDVPQLPSGYAGMVPLAYIPPLWRWVMDRRVKAHYQGDLSRANLSPAARAKLGL